MLQDVLARGKFVLNFSYMRQFLLNKINAIAKSKEIAHLWGIYNSTFI